MTYHFDAPIDRRGSGDLKHEALREMFGKADLLPLWVADMDWATPPFVVNAIKARLEHPILGYTVMPKDYWKVVSRWILEHHQWTVSEEWMTYVENGDSHPRTPVWNIHTNVRKPIYEDFSPKSGPTRKSLRKMDYISQGKNKR